MSALADDLPALLNVVSGLGPVFLLLTMATGLHLSIPKIVIVSCSQYLGFDLRRRLHDRLGSLAVRRVARNPRVPIGPAASLGRCHGEVLPPLRGTLRLPGALEALREKVTQ